MIGDQEATHTQDINCTFQKPTPYAYPLMLRPQLPLLSGISLQEIIGTNPPFVSLLDESIC